VEVSDTSLAKDEMVKAPLYAAAGIQVFWIVNIAMHQLEVFSGPTTLGYKQRDIFQLGDQVILPDMDLKVSLLELIGPKPE